MEEGRVEMEVVVVKVERMVVLKEGILIEGFGVDE